MTNVYNKNVKFREAYEIKSPTEMLILHEGDHVKLVLEDDEWDNETESTKDNPVYLTVRGVIDWCDADGLSLDSIDADCDMKWRTKEGRITDNVMSDIYWGNVYSIEVIE